MKLSIWAKKIGIVALTLGLLCTVMNFQSLDVRAGEPETASSIVETTGNTMVEDRSISKTFRNISLEYGESRVIAKFNMKVSNQKAHDAFNIIVSGVSGSSYKVFIKNSDKKEAYESKEGTTDKTFRTTGASSTATYTVKIVNTGKKTLKIKSVKISSFYN